MSQNIPEERENLFFKKLLKLTQLHEYDKENIKLPKICILGNISSGKSSVLESIIDLDILPRGDGRVTRRPLELNLHHINSGEPYAIFEEKKDIKLTDFKKLQETIEQLTNEVCLINKNISNKPIILNIYSKSYPNLTLIDLPGLDRIAVGECTSNLARITHDIPIKYIDDPLTIILCVIPANSDIYTSDALRMAKEIDMSGKRTIGVLTKLDIMDKGTDGRKTLLNEEVPLKLGYVGIRNKSKQDRMNNISMTETKKKEKDFFKSNPAYNNLPSELLGIDSLINKLTQLYFKIVKINCPNINKSINGRIEMIEKELIDLNVLFTTMQIIVIDDEEKNSVPIDKKKGEEKPKDPPSKSEDDNKKVKKKGYGNLFG